MAMTEQQFNEAVGRLPEAPQLALSQISVNATNGSMWVVISEEVLVNHFELIKSSDQFTVYRLNEKEFLLNANPELYLNGLNSVDGAMGAKLAKMYVDNKHNAMENFEKRLKTFIREASKGNRRHTIGIFSVNSTPHATAPNGERIPAFQLTFGQLGSLLHKASKETGKTFQVEFAPNAVVNNVSDIPTGFNLTGVQMCRDNNAMMITLIVN